MDRANDGIAHKDIVCITRSVSNTLSLLPPLMLLYVCINLLRSNLNRDCYIRAFEWKQPQISILAHLLSFFCCCSKWLLGRIVWDLPPVYNMFLESGGPFGAPQSELSQRQKWGFLSHTELNL